jgi:hypothetical protein
MSQLNVKLSDRADALIAQLQKEIFNRRRKKVSAAGVIETLVESGAKSQSDKRFATSWKNLVADIEKAAKVADAHGAKPASLSDEEWALVLSHRTRTPGAATPTKRSIKTCCIKSCSGQTCSRQTCGQQSCSQQAGTSQARCPQARRQGSCVDQRRHQTHPLLGGQTDGEGRQPSDYHDSACRRCPQRQWCSQATGCCLNPGATRTSGHQRLHWPWCNSR